MALVCSELFGGGDDAHIFTVSDKDGALAGCYEDEAIFAVINVDIGGDIKDKKLAIIAFIDIELLLFDGIYFFNFEGLVLIEKSIVIGIIFFFNCFWF